MNLIGRFKTLPKGHQYSLTVIHMLTNYTWCFLLQTKEAYKVAYAYLVNNYPKFGVLHETFLRRHALQSCICLLS